MTRNPLTTEPVAVQAVTTVLVWVTARYGLNLSTDQATVVAGALIVVGAPIVRHLVRPVAKEPDWKVEQVPGATEAKADPGPSRIATERPPAPPPPEPGKRTFGR